MIRSKYVFLIFAVIYLFVAIASLCSLLTITENVLLGLSVSSLFISLADAIENICITLSIKNAYNFSLKLASDYLKCMISQGCTVVNNYDMCNIKQSIDDLQTRDNPIHPTEYNKKSFFKICTLVSITFFIIGIACFIILPFINLNANNNAAKITTILAFTFLCVNLFCIEMGQDMGRDKDVFENDKVSIISLLFPGFREYYIAHTQHFASSKEIEKTTCKTQPISTAVTNKADSK